MSRSREALRVALHLPGFLCQSDEAEDFKLIALLQNRRDVPRARKPLLEHRRDLGING